VQVLVDIIDRVTGGFRFVALLIFLGFLGVGLMLTLAAPAAIEEAGERAESLGEKAIAAAKEEVRNEQLAKDGWGRPDMQSAYEADGYSDEDAGGWGSDTQ